MESHGGKLVGLAVVIVILGLAASGMVYLAPHGAGRGHYEAHFEPSEPWGFEARPLEIILDGPRGTGGTRTVGRFIQVGPLTIEHWD
jgi:hypothetical protein